MAIAHKTDSTLTDQSTLTDRYQTTVPLSVRRTLKLNKGDKLHYSIRGREVVIRRAPTDVGEDPVLADFLIFLAHDMSENPQRIQQFDAGLAERIRGLTKGIEVDLDRPLSDEDE